jgi:acetyl esterase/lipase
LVADLDLVRETVAAECEALGVTGRLATAGSPAAVAQALAGADTGAFVVLPGPDPEVRRLMSLAGPHADRTVWCDLVRTGPVEVAGGAAHLYGRGIWGVAWAIRHAVHRLRHPARRIRYGSDPDQWGELRPPASGAGRPPVAVLVHGGYWRPVWTADLMDALAIDLAERGFATWNLEYRRPDPHGWEATTVDVASGLAALADLDVDLDRVAVLGHSAGGQLGMRAAADSRQVAIAVSLAGVLDLAEGQRRGIGNGAVAAALGGTPETAPDRYAAADPMARLPLGVPQLVVQGRDDDPDLVDNGRRYARAALAAGDEVTYLDRPGDHFAVIDPTSDLWRETADQICARLGEWSTGGSGPSRI